MLKKSAKYIAITAVCLTILFGLHAIAQDARVANVAGTWNIASTGEGGERASQTVQFSQRGNQLTGHFKGPHQTGGLSGVVNGNHVFFETKTRTVLHFRGTVEADRIEGTLGVQGKTGVFTAIRVGG